MWLPSLWFKSHFGSTRNFISYFKFCFGYYYLLPFFICLAIVAPCCKTWLKATVLQSNLENYQKVFLLSLACSSSCQDFTMFWEMKWSFHSWDNVQFDHRAKRGCEWSKHINPLPILLHVFIAILWSTFRALKHETPKFPNWIDLV